MRLDELRHLVCPATRQCLELVEGDIADGTVTIGVLRAPDGRTYPVTHGVPDLTYPTELPESDADARDFYDGRADDYDKFLHLTFRTHGEDEGEVRSEFIGALGLCSSSRVLEVAAGTGRDSMMIAGRLGEEGLLCLQDISPGMLSRNRDRLASVCVPTSYSLSNACYLPYPDDYFDEVYSFGGLGEFSDIKRSLAEMVRVSRCGAKIVVGDESMPPWLRETEFCRILSTTNPQFMAEMPLDKLPVEARDVSVRWVIGGVFYLIGFVVGDGEPVGDFDFEIPGVRGGTLRTRYEGQLEGVTPEAKELAHRARERMGVSMHQWLDRVVCRAALYDLGGADEG